MPRMPRWKPRLLSRAELASSNMPAGDGYKGFQPGFYERVSGWEIVRDDGAHRYIIITKTEAFSIYLNDADLKIFWEKFGTGENDFDVSSKDIKATEDQP